MKDIPSVMYDDFGEVIGFNIPCDEETRKLRIQKLDNAIEILKQRRIEIEKKKSKKKFWFF